MSTVKVTEDEIAWLEKNCPYLPNQYLAFLREYRFKPDEHLYMKFDQNPREFTLEITGKWIETILYEVPLLSIISEAYFLHVDDNWDHIGQYEKAYSKAEKLIRGGCHFAEFGTRRRRDFKTQDLVIRALVDCNKALNGTFTGTSNVYFAKKYNVPPIGTMAHELFMGTASVTRDYTNANAITLAKWQETYRDALGIALTDTFGTEAFLHNFTGPLAKKFIGVRQDSGDPRHFVDRMAEFYDAEGIDKSTKTIVFSDGLDDEKCLELQKYATSKGLKCSFGVGTFLSSESFIILQSLIFR